MREVSTKNLWEHILSRVKKKKKKERKYKAFEWFLFQNEEPRDESMKE